MWLGYQLLRRPIHCYHRIYFSSLSCCRIFSLPCNQFEPSIQNSFVYKSSSVVPEVRGFHGTRALGMPTRRRRSNPGGGIDESDREEPGIVRGNPFVSPDDFHSLSVQLLEKLYERCLPLMKINDSMKIVHGASCIDENAKLHGIEVNDSEVDGPYLLVDLGPLHGQYVLIVDKKRRLVLFQSPISGHLLYDYNIPSETWMNLQDGHNLEGMFVRDLCRKIKGYPNL